MERLEKVIPFDFAQNFVLDKDKEMKIGSQLNLVFKIKLDNLPKINVKVFTWDLIEIIKMKREIAKHCLNIDPKANLV